MRRPPVALGRIAGRCLRVVHERVLEVEQLADAEPLHHVQAGQRDEPVRARMRAVVRVERLTELDPRGRLLELRLAGEQAAARPLVGALDRHEPLRLQSQRGAQQGDLDLAERSSSRPSNPAVTDSAASRPAVKSASARPPVRRGTVSPGRGSASSRPDSACPIRSYAGRLESGPCASERGHAHDHAPLVHLVHALAVEAELARPVRQAVVHERVGGRDQLAAPLAPLRRLEVERDRALAAVERVEVAALAGLERVVAAPFVAARRLDLDHVGAEVGEEHRRERGGHVLPVVEDAEAGERETRAHRSHASSTASFHERAERLRR